MKKAYIFLIILILSALAVLSSGCGQKKLNVSTTTLRLNKDGSITHVIIDDNSSLNNKFDNYLNDFYNTKNNLQKIGGEIIPEKQIEDNNFHCSGKFNFSEDPHLNNIENEKKNKDNESLNNKENKERNDNDLLILKKN